MQNCFASQIPLQSSALASIRSNSPGRITKQPNRPATGLKCRWLKVTIASACPLTAVSKTISSFGSGNAGLQRNAIVTRLQTSARPPRTLATSSSLAHEAFRCSGRFRTSSYSSISGTESSNSNRRSSAANNIWREAPVSLRKAATSTSVSRTQASTILMILQAILQVNVG